MRHQKQGRKFNMSPAQRRLLLSGLACQLLEHEKIKTGEARAKEVRSVVEQAITLGKRGDLHARRQAVAMLRNKQIVYKLFKDVAPRYEDRPGAVLRPAGARAAPRRVRARRADATAGSPATPRHARRVRACGVARPVSLPA